MADLSTLLKFGADPTAEAPLGKAANIAPWLLPVLGGVVGISSLAKALGRRSLRKAAAQAVRENSLDLFSSGAGAQKLAGAPIEMLRDMRGELADAGIKTRWFQSLRQHSPTSATGVFPTYNVMTQGKWQPIQVAMSRDIPVYDFDLGMHEATRRPASAIAHPGMSDEVTIGGLDEAIEIARQRASRLKQAGIPTNLRLYLTPGGVRAIEMGHRATPSNAFSDLLRPDKVDPSYAKFTQQHSILIPKTTRTGTPAVMQPAFAFRTGRKPGRAPAEDYGAAYVGRVATGPELPTSTAEIAISHDNPVNALMGTDQLEKFLQTIALEIPHLKTVDKNILTKLLTTRYGIPISMIPAVMAMLYALPESSAQSEIAQ